MTAANRLFWTLLLAALGLGAAVLAIVPSPPQPLDTGWDKLNHVFAFAALAFCARLAAEGSRWPAAAWQGLVLAWGVLIELAQTQVPGRHGEWPDVLANAAGMTIGLGAAWLALRWTRFKGRRAPA